MKECKKCSQIKETSDFNRLKISKDGLRYECRSCEREYRQLHKDRQNEYMKNYRKENYEELKEKDKERRNKNVDKIRRDKSKYYQENKQIWKKSTERNKEKIRERKDKYAEENEEKMIMWKKESYERRKKEPGYKEYRNKYAREYRSRNPHIIAWRNTLRRVIYQYGQNKSGKTIDILGYSATDFKSHIESLFLEGMCWDNWGSWHIDHIIPVCQFDKNTHPSVVNALSNLRPLWAKDNLSKKFNIDNF